METNDEKKARVTFEQPEKKGMDYLIDEMDKKKVTVTFGLQIHIRVTSAFAK